MIKLSKTYSQNAKLGPGFRVTYRKVGDAEAGGTCPSTCRHLKNRTCYAMFGMVQFGVPKEGPDQQDGDLVYDWLLSMKGKDVKIRHFVAGDLGSKDGGVDHHFTERLRDGHRDSGVKGFGFTHFWREIEPEEVNIKELTFNASCDTPQEAVEAVRQGWPTVLSLDYDVDPEHLEPLQVGDDLVEIKVCPNQLDKTKTCSSCMRCFRKNRDFVVGFIAHGARAKHVR